MELIVNKRTIVKGEPAQSTELSANQMAMIDPGEYPIHWSKTEQGHLCVSFIDKGDTPLNRHNLYVSLDFAETRGREKDNDPDPSKEICATRANPTGDRGPKLILNLPSLKAVHAYDPIHRDKVANFTWAEALHANIVDGKLMAYRYAPKGFRVPSADYQVHNIIKIGEVLEAVRERLGNKPIRINSWLRPEPYNRSIGGAPNSRHTHGDAVDYAHPDLNPGQIAKEVNDLFLKGGSAPGPGFHHGDARGYKSRWAYPRCSYRPVW